MAKFDLTINKSKCGILLQDKDSKITKLEGIEVKKCVKFLGHHFSANIAENLRIALNKCLKNTGRIAQKAIFKDSVLNRVMKSCF